MALFASPFDIFAMNHGHTHDPFLHRRRRRRVLNHGNPFKMRHNFDPFFNILAALSDDDDRMDADDNNQQEKNFVVATTFDPEVVENELGYLLTARVPGVSASDVVVAVKTGGEHDPRADDVLTVRSAKHRHVKVDLRLPRGAASVNVADVSASCIDGILRIAVPKLTPTSDAIVVAAEPPARAGDDNKMDADVDEEETGHAQNIVLQVPGYSRDDVTVTRKRPADELIVAGKSRRRGGGEFSRTYRLTDPHATVTATCADGLLTIRVVNPVVAPFVVSVSADKMLPAADGAPDTDVPADVAAAEEKEKRVTLMRHAVPGASAGDFKVEVRGGNKLRAHADYAVAGLGRRRFDFAVLLPSGLDRSTLRANVSDGLMTVTAAAPLASVPVAVKVSGDHPAGLLPAPPPAPAAAAAAAAADDVHVEEEADGEQ